MAIFLFCSLDLILLFVLWNKRIRLEFQSYRPIYSVLLFLDHINLNGCQQSELFIKWCTHNAIIHAEAVPLPRFQKKTHWGPRQLPNKLLCWSLKVNNRNTCLYSFTVKVFMFDKKFLVPLIVWHRRRCCCLDDDDDDRRRPSLIWVHLPISATDGTRLNSLLRKRKRRSRS